MNVLSGCTGQAQLSEQNQNPRPYYDSFHSDFTRTGPVFNTSIELIKNHFSSGIVFIWIDVRLRRSIVAEQPSPMV